MLPALFDASVLPSLRASPACRLPNMPPNRNDGNMTPPWRSRAAAGVVASSCALVLLSACGGSPSSPSSLSLSVGQWTGTTEQGTPITFTVSADEILTTITVGYRFNGCSGTQTFSNLTVATAPDLICIPGPCSGTVSSYRSFAYSS